MDENVTRYIPGLEIVSYQRITYIKTQRQPVDYTNTNMKMFSFT